jgi:hypothetical protein
MGGKPAKLFSRYRYGTGRRAPEHLGENSADQEKYLVTFGLPAVNIRG